MVLEVEWFTYLEEIMSPNNLELLEKRLKYTPVVSIDGDELPKEQILEHFVSLLEGCATSQLKIITSF